jgi:hypothetical protein
MTRVEPLLIKETPGAPIACDMTGATDTPEERLAEYGMLFSHALVERERIADAVELRFAAKPGVAEWVTSLARREAACCPFATYQVTFSGDRVLWRISSQAGPVAQALLDEFHALPDRIADGVTGLYDRLSLRGVSVASPSPGRYVVDEVGDRVKGRCGCSRPEP